MLHHSSSRCVSNSAPNKRLCNIHMVVILLDNGHRKEHRQCLNLSIIASHSVQKYMNKWQNWYIDITATSEADAIASVQKAWYRGHSNHAYSIKAKEKHSMDEWCGYFKEYYR